MENGALTLILSLMAGSISKRINHLSYPYDNDNVIIVFLNSSYNGHGFDLPGFGQVVSLVGSSLLIK